LVKRRISEHNEGHDPKSFTYNRRPVVLKYTQHFNDVNQAISWEKKLKGWNRKKKEALFNENWKEIVRLAKRKSQSSRASD
jgi:putative endonuclease